MRMKFIKKKEHKIEFTGKPVETLRHLIDWKLKYHRRVKVTRMEEKNEKGKLTIRVYYRKRRYHTPLLRRQ
jgi:hypothetical protein